MRDDELPHSERPLLIGSGKQADQDLPEPLPPGRRIDHFELLRLLARGGMGEVYLARDTKLGRRVAIKLIHAALLGSEEAAARFMFEARATAQCNHPHIVTIYAVGEHEGRPYLALEYLPGETLAKRRSERSLSLNETLRISLAVAEALAEAHGKGVLHRDLKPENVLIGRDGSVGVVDFGLAGYVEPDDEPAPLSFRPGLDDSGPGSFRQLIAFERGGLRGTPEHMAPEQWLGLDCTAAVDIWALGVIIFELCAGRLPFDEDQLVLQCLAVTSSRPAPRLDEQADVPAELADLVARCLAKQPQGRPTAEELVDALRRLLEPARRLTEDGPCPFRGLSPFDEGHAAFFFGRDAEITALVERSRHCPVLPVVGPSGVGKSSFVQAGVIPRLQEQERWLVLSLRVGSRPFQALAYRLEKCRRARRNDLPGLPESGDTLVGARPLAASLERSPRILCLELRNIARAQGAKVLLFVDQLEELFTHVTDPATRQAFITALCTAAEDPLDPVRVIFTVRDDFLGRLVMGPQAREVLSNVFVLQQPTADMLRTVLGEPLRLAGYRFEDPSLPAEMVAEVRAEPACLPLLQFAARLLWQRRDRPRRLLLRAEYDRLGGVAGALAQHADGVLDGFSAAQQALARQLLLRLVRADRTRRLLGRSRAVEGSDETARVLARLIDARLIAVVKADEDDEEGEGQLELAHESLIHTWSRLARWIDESHEQLTFLEQVSQAAELWDKRGRRAAELWADEGLREARHRLRQVETLPQLVESFLSAGQARERRRLWRRRGLIASAMAFLALLAVVLTVQKQEADEQRQLAELREQEAQRARGEALQEGARAALGQGRVLEARAKLRRALELAGEASAPERALWWLLSTDPLQWRHELGAPVYRCAFSPAGERVAAAAQDRTVHLLDVRTGADTVLRGHADYVFAVAFSPDGARLVSGGYDGKLLVWDARTGAALRTVAGHEGGVFGLAFSPDGQQLASAGADGQIRLWAVRGDQLQLNRVLSAHDERIFSVRYSPDGRTLVSASRDGTVKLWDAPTGAHRATLRGHEGIVYAATFSPDGRRLATAGADRTVRLWDAGSAAEKAVLRGHTDRVLAVAFSPDGRLIASSGFDQTVRLWRSADGSLQSLLPREHGGAVYGLSFSADGRRLATSCFDKSVRVYDLARLSAARPPPVGHVGGARSVSFSTRADLLASGGLDGTVRLWDVRTGAERQVLEGHTDGVRDVSFSPDGKLLASSSVDQTIRLWDVETGQVRLILQGHRGGIRWLSFSPDGKLLASAGFDLTVRLWDVETGAQRRLLEGHTEAVFAVLFSPDGRRLASAGRDRTIRLWDLATGAAEVLAGHADGIYGLAFSGDGSVLYSGANDKTVRRWRLTGGPAGAEPSELIYQSTGRIYDVALHPSRPLLAIAGSEPTARLRRLDGAEELLLSGHRSEVGRIVFSPSGELVATASEDGTVRLWSAATGQPYWRAPALLLAPAWLLSQRGWTALADPATTAAAPPGLGPRARQLLEGEAASSAAGGRLLCVRLRGGGLSVFDLAADRPILERKDLAPTELVRLPKGCAAVTPEAVWLASAGGKLEKLALDGSPKAVGYGQGIIVVSTATGFSLFDEQGQLKRRLSTPVQPAAVGYVHDAQGAGRVLAGHQDGSLELLPGFEAAAPGASPTFEQTPSSEPLRIIAGPAQTAIVGYADGTVGMWHLPDGQRLHQTRLHGPISYLETVGDKLYAVSELGQHLSWDLSPFQRSYCELLREISRQIEVVWEGGKPVPRGPPPGHPCFTPTP